MILIKSRLTTITAILCCAPLLWPLLPDGDKQGKQPGKAAGSTAQGRVPDKSKVPTPPPDARPLPPVLEPARSPVERRDLMQRFAGRPRIAGFYRLRSMVQTGGGSVQNSRGYLFIGQRHLTMQLYAPSPVPDKVNLQSVVRTYRIEGKQLIMRSLLGHRNRTNGDITLDKPGEVLQYRYSLVGAQLRIYSSPGAYLEFDRIE